MDKFYFNRIPDAEEITRRGKEVLEKLNKMSSERSETALEKAEYRKTHRLTDEEKKSLIKAEFEKIRNENRD